MPNTAEVILHASNVTVSTTEGTTLLHIDSLDIRRGDRIAVVGASGSGKSLLVQALSQWLPSPGRPQRRPTNTRSSIPSGLRMWRGANSSLAERPKTPASTRSGLRMSGTVEYTVEGHPLAREDALSVLWQDSLQALNPTRTVGWQLEHTLARRGHLRTDAPAWLERVGMADPALAMHSYPHQLSGGMRQRVAIALALCGGQPLVIADEPTTALDTVRQAEVLRLIDSVCTAENRTLLMCTHDIAVASQLCNQVLVVDGGAIVERGSWAEVFGSPQTAAAAELKDHVRCIPAPVCSRKAVAEPRVRLRGVSFSYGGRASAAGAAHSSSVRGRLGVGTANSSSVRGRLGGEAAHSSGVRNRLTRKITGHRREQQLEDVNLELEPGRLLGIVGASGCGKTTLASVLVGLHEPTSGSVEIARTDGTWAPPKDLRPHIQMVFQSPYSAFNPRRRLGESLTAAARAGTTTREVEDLVHYWVQRVDVPCEALERRPSGVSGGQLQRLALARALLARPTVLVADEVISALDLANQDRILSLLATATEDLGIATVLISHDLSAVATVADRIAVMDEGRIVECGTCADILASAHPRTRELFDAVPQFEVPSPPKPNSGLMT